MLFRIVFHRSQNLSIIFHCEIRDKWLKRKQSLGELLWYFVIVCSKTVLGFNKPTECSSELLSCSSCQNSMCGQSLESELNSSTGIIPTQIQAASLASTDILHALTCE